MARKAPKHSVLRESLGNQAGQECSGKHAFREGKEISCVGAGVAVLGWDAQGCVAWWPSVGVEVGVKDSTVDHGDKRQHLSCGPVR